MKRFLVSYEHLGDEYMTEIKGENFEDARLRLENIAKTGKLLGEAIISLPARALKELSNKPSIN